jgi:hypothetical protein
MTAPRAGPRGPLGLAGLLIAAALLTGCGSSDHTDPAATIPATLLAHARPIGRGPRFDPPVSGPVPGRCTRPLGGRDGVHVELFAANRVVILPAGIGVRSPRSFSDGRLVRGRCYGDLVTVDPTGVVLVRPGSHLVLSTLFHAWGQPLSPIRLASFSASMAAPVTVFVNGRRWGGAPPRVPLTVHSEIVVEVGPHVPPHASYTFPPGV